ncbi:peptidoglycan-binding protein, partial [Pseudomonas fragi]|nr:peptidoglycan-binding protein [Pseudomonas sp. GC01]
AVAATGTRSSYSISTRIRWIFELTPQIPIDILAELGLDYDGSRKPGEEFAGSVIGTINIDFLGPIQIGYRFGAPTTSSGVTTLRDLPLAAAALPANSTLWMSWKGFRAEYDFDKQVVAFSLTGWTVGSLITALVEMLGDPYFTLPAPWSVLNSIALNGFSIQFDLKSGAKSRVTAKYTLPAPIDLGFLTIKGLQFLQVDGKVTLAIDGSCSVPGLNEQPLFNPEQGGQDVQNMPPVPGQGNAYFDLKLLALGQRIAIAGAPTFKTTQEVIKALEAIPASSGPGMPFDPSQQKPGQPYYNRSSNWLGAMHFGILRIGESAKYAIDFMVVFNDPDLYGLRLALNGDKMKVLAGLAIDVLYKKITDDIGCYQIEFTLPSVLRNLDF